MKMGLISCTKLKADHRCTAEEMYSPSDLYSKALEYCKNHYDKVMILSAKHGALELSAVIDPYDLTLNNMPSKERKKWAAQVFEQLKGIDASQIFFHTGKKYREHLIPLLESQGKQCTIPLKGMGIGQQKAWYIKKGGI